MSRVSKYKRILMVRLDRIGDVLLSTPAIRAVRKAYPEAYLAFMVRPYARDVLEGNPDLDEVIVYDKAKGIRGSAAMIRLLRAKRFDLAIILHPTTRTHIVTYLSRIPERVGFDRKLGSVLTKKIPHTKQHGLKHEIDYTLDVVRSLGIEPASRVLSMPLNSRSEANIERLFLERGIDDSDTLVVINPGASCRSKRWLPRRFAAVADELSKVRGVKIILLAAPSDKEYADSVERVMENPCINLSGMTTVADLASILRRARLFISNDSGPVHISCAVGTPVIAIFGRADKGLSPIRWGPSNLCDTVLHKDVGCVTCLAHNCSKGFKCLEAVTVDDVVDAARKILGRR